MLSTFHSTIDSCLFMQTTGCPKRQYCQRSRLTRFNKFSGGLLTLVESADPREKAFVGSVSAPATASLFTRPSIDCLCTKYRDYTNACVANDINDHVID